MTREQQISYWRASLMTIAAILAAWFTFACLLPILLVDALDHLQVGGVPLGFWVAQQGAPVAFVLLVAVYVRVMNALDRRYGVYER
jgi:putative solute:sodium symporter small subunit